MATSGVAYTNTIWDSYFWVSWSLSSQSVANNTSVISWSCGVYSPHQWYSNAVRMSAVYINGSCVYGGGTYSFGGSVPGTYTLGSGSLTIGHNGDGTGSVSISGFSGWLYDTGSPSSSGGSWALPNIPRKSDLSISSTILTANNIDSITATINKKASAFTDQLTLTFGSKSKEITISNGSATIKVPESWASEIPNNMSGTATLTLRTYNGNSLIGSTEKSITIVVKYYSPSLSITSLTPVDTPRTFSSAKYVRLLSKVRVKSTASGYQGSSITNQKVVINNVAYEGADITSGYLVLSGTVQILVTCTDSRGQTNEITQNITVVEYYPPRVSVECSSSAAENKNTINVSTRISSVNGLNAKTYRLLGTWIDENGTVHTDELLSSGTITNPDFTLYHNGIDPTITYTYKVRVQDSVGYDIAEAITGVICISERAGGKGVRLFGAAEKDGFDMNSKLDNIFALNNQSVIKSLLDLMHPVGDIVSNASPSFNPNIEWGGVWRRLNGVYQYSPMMVLDGSVWRFKDIISDSAFDIDTTVTLFAVVQGNGYKTRYPRVLFENWSNESRIRLYYEKEGTYILIYQKTSSGEVYFNENYRELTVISHTSEDELIIEYMSRVADVNSDYDYEIGTIIEAGLPNIEGAIGSLGGSEPKFGTPSGAFGPYTTVNYYSATTNAGSGYTRYDGFRFNAANSNPIYGNSDTVRPRSLVANAWLRIE